MRDLPTRITALLACTLLLSGCSGGKSRPSAQRTYLPDTERGMAVYKVHCGSCHDTGNYQAPTLDEPYQWDTRTLDWTTVLRSHVVRGWLAPPSQSTRSELTETGVADAMHFMLRRIADEEED